MALPARIDIRDHVRDFINCLMNEEDLNFHPDDGFHTYINVTDGSRAYTKEQCEERERLLDQCFEIAGDDVYVIGCELQCELLGLPSPTRADYP